MSDNMPYTIGDDQFDVLIVNSKSTRAELIESHKGLADVANRLDVRCDRLEREVADLKREASRDRGLRSDMQKMYMDKIAMLQRAVKSQAHVISEGI